MLNIILDVVIAMVKEQIKMNQLAIKYFKLAGREPKKSPSFGSKFNQKGLQDSDTTCFWVLVLVMVIIEQQFIIFIL